MTPDPDGSNPEDVPEGGSPDVSPRLDVDAAWRSIVDHYGDRADLSDLEPSPGGPPTGTGEPTVDPTEGPTAAATGEPTGKPTDEPPEPPEAPRFTAFDRRWQPEPLNTEATWDDEGHFVPPVPPPLPKLEPRRKLAWIGLFGSPLLMLVAVVFGWQYPDWVSIVLVGGFLGGFGYLIATMPRTRGEDGSGDNGAIV